MDFLWITEEVAEQFFNDVSSLEYTPENELSNDYRSRDSWEMRLFDAWGHCFMGAAATRDIGETATWALGGSYEVLHESISWISLNLVSHDSLIQDTYNQSVGRSIGTSHPTGDLGTLCFDAMVQGRLDLTLAGIPRGTRLRRNRYGQRQGTDSARQRIAQWQDSSARSRSREA